MSSRPGKTAPRLLQDLLTYDPRYEERAGRNLLSDPPAHHDPEAPRVLSVPRRNCRHNFMTKHEQSMLPKAGEDPDSDTVYKIAAFCMECRWHLDLRVTFRSDGSKTTPCRQGNMDFPIHHFLCSGSGNGATTDHYGYPNIPRNFQFQCSSPQCPVELHIRLYPPRLKDQYINLMTSRVHLRKRLETAKSIDSDRADENMARPVDALDFLGTYLNDSLQPKTGKTRVPLLNRKFLKTFGKDCDEMLNELGWRRHVEHDEESDSEVVAWNLPQPPARSSPLDPDNERSLIEDVRYELTSHILAMPESERKQIRNATQPQPSLTELRRALGCLDYDKKTMTRTEVRNTNNEEDHPYFAGLGAMADFSDALILFSYARQVAVDLANSTYYFECLQDIAIGRNSPILGEYVQILASQGQTNRKEVASAYAYLGIEPGHANHLTDDIIIGKFRARLQDISPAVIEETRSALRTIGNARQSDKIIQEASNAIETYEQAMSWLGLDDGQTDDDFVCAMFSIKTSDSPSNREIATKAVRIIAKARNSKRLMSFVDTGTMDPPEMDVAEAYALLGVTERAAALDLDVLQAQLQSYNATNPQNEAKYEQAYALICKDQHENHKHSVIHDSGPPKKHYPLAAWPVGCQNIGNTCYLNSVLQFLFTIKPLRDMVLNFDSYKEDTTPEALEKKRVGRSAVTVDRVKTAQEFVFELQKLFNTMINAPTESVRPPTRLACLALLKEVTPVPKKLASAGNSGLGDIGGVPVHGPMPNPAMLAQPGDAHVPELADSVMGDVDDDKKSETSSTVALADPEEEKFFDEGTNSNNGQDFQIVDKPDTMPQPPSRPPPVPPRPQAAAQIAQPPNTSTELRAVEQVAQQQDAAEILNNVFDLLSCAMKGTGTTEDGEQLDLIKKLFFSEITTVRMKNGVESKTTAINDNVLIYPGERNRHLYAALDSGFGLQEVDDDGPSSNVNGQKVQTTKYEFFKSAAPIVIINLHRLKWIEGDAKKLETHVRLDDIIYLDRYLEKTKSVPADQLLERRQKLWELDLKGKALEVRQSMLTKTDLQVSQAEAVDEAANFLGALAQDKDDESAEMEGVFPSGTSDMLQQLRESVRHLETEAESLDPAMRDIEAQAEALFQDLKDHPYWLHSVFVHRGTATGGHYWIFIYDFQNKVWRKYNDERVDEVEDDDDIYTQEEKYPATSTGIVYVRSDCVDELTEAVCRNPAQPEQGDVEMKDVDNTAEFGQAQVQVINGVESGFDGDDDPEMSQYLAYVGMDGLDGVAFFDPPKEKPVPVEAKRSLKRVGTLTLPMGRQTGHRRRY